MNHYGTCMNSRIPTSLDSEALLLHILQCPVEQITYWARCNLLVKPTDPHLVVRWMCKQAFLPITLGQPVNNHRLDTDRPRLDRGRPAS